MNISFYLVKKFVADMVKAQKEIDSARSKESYNGDDEYIGYREGVYDTYFDLLTTLGYSLEEINKMESEVRNDAMGMED